MIKDLEMGRLSGIMCVAQWNHRGPNKREAAESEGEMWLLDQRASSGLMAELCGPQGRNRAERERQEERTLCPEFNQPQAENTQKQIVGTLVTGFSWSLFPK